MAAAAVRRPKLDRTAGPQVGRCSSHSAFGTNPEGVMIYLAGHADTTRAGRAGYMQPLVALVRLSY